MPKRAYNDFVRKHPKAMRLRAQVSSKGPGTYTPKGLKLPTPYGLFEEWCHAHLTGDWALDGGKVVNSQRVFSILVVLVVDAKALQKAFGFTKIATGRYAGQTRVGFGDSKYTNLAKALGYDIK